MNRKLFFCALSVLFIVSCIIPGQTISPPPPTASPFSPPPTWTPPPTATGLLKATEVVFPTFTVVPPITLASNLSETPQGKWANYIPFVSPNGDWTAYFNFSEIRIVKGEDSAWTLPCDLFEGCSYIMPTQWSKDSKYLYFGASTDMSGPPQDGAFASFSTAGRINVKTGEWDRLFPDPGSFFEFTVSPDGKYVAYVERLSSEQDANRAVLLTVRNLETREIVNYSANGLDGGDIVWSPYKPRIVFATQDPYNGSFIYYFDVESDVFRPVLKDETRKLSIDSWLENNLVLINRTKLSGKTPSPIYLNPFTGELLPVPATPTP